MNNISVVPSLQMVTTVGPSSSRDLSLTGTVTFGDPGGIGSIYQDNVDARFGTGSDAAIYYDGTNLIIDPKEVGSGYIDTNGGDLRVNTIGLGDTAPALGVLMSATLSGSTIVGILSGVITYSGTSPVVGCFQSAVTYNGTVDYNAFGAIVSASNQRQNETSNILSGIFGATFSAATAQKLNTNFYVMVGAQFSISDQSGGGNHGTNNVFAYGLYCPAIPDFAGINEKKAGILCEDNIIVSADKSVFFEGALVGGPGDTRIYYNAASGELRFVVDNTQVAAFDNDRIDWVPFMKMIAQDDPGGPEEGDVWCSSSQKALSTYSDGISQRLSGCVFTQTNTATVANTTTETTLIGSGVGTLTLPANFFVAGKTIRFKAWGFYSAIATPGNIEIRFKFGSTTICTSGTTAPTASAANRGWYAEGMVTCRTTGGTGTVMGQGVWGQSSNVTTYLIRDMENTATVTIDTTATQTVNLTAQWATADAGNTISGTNFSLEILN